MSLWHAYFLQYIHNTSPIACPWGQAMGDVLWVQMYDLCSTFAIDIIRTLWHIKSLPTGLFV